MSTTTIPFANLQLVLAARKANPRCRWAAKGEHTTNYRECHHRRRLSAELEHLGVRHVRSLVAPMDRGHVQRLIETTHRYHGPAETKRTWGDGIRALMREPAHVLPATAR